MSLQPIPTNQRSALIKPFLKKFLSELRNLQATELQKESLYALTLHGIIYPWVVPPDSRTTQTEAARATFEKHGVDGAQLVNDLNSLLDDDEHLRKCCTNPLILAKLLDKFVSQILERTKGEPPSDEEFELTFESFSQQVYEEPFAFLVFSHVFNLDGYTNILEFGSIQIRKLAPSEIPYLFGESTSQSLIHPYQAGEYFIVNESDDVILDDLGHLQKAHDEADNLAIVFQYFEDGDLRTRK